MTKATGADSLGCDTKRGKKGTYWLKETFRDGKDLLLRKRQQRRGGQEGGCPLGISVSKSQEGE